MHAVSRALVASALVWAIGSVVSAEDPDSATATGSLEQVLQQFDQVQRTIHSLSAGFEETSTNVLLKEPVVSRGQFYLTKPDAVMWSYTAPEQMQFVIANDEYVGYFPDRKRAERRDIERWKEQIFRFFGLGQASSELFETYEISLGTGDSSVEGTVLLVLDPKTRKVKKRMQSVRFWVDSESYLPVQVEYRDNSGNTRIVRFVDVQMNPDLAVNHYRIEIPADVTVTTGFSGLQSLASAQ